MRFSQTFLLIIFLSAPAYAANCHTSISSTQAITHCFTKRGDNFTVTRDLSGIVKVHATTAGGNIDFATDASWEPSGKFREYCQSHIGDGSVEITCIPPEGPGYMLNLRRTGHVEFDTIDNDSFNVKVAPDGSTRGTEFVGFPKPKIMFFSCTQTGECSK